MAPAEELMPWIMELRRRESWVSLSLLKASLGYLSHRSKSSCFEFLAKVLAALFDGVDRQQGFVEESARGAGNRGKPIP